VTRLEQLLDEFSTHDAALARIEKLEAAIRKAIRHANRHGMADWPVFVAMRKAINE